MPREGNAGSGERGRPQPGLGGGRLPSGGTEPGWQPPHPTDGASSATAAAAELPSQKTPLQNATGVFIPFPAGLVPAAPGDGRDRAIFALRVSQALKPSNGKASGVEIPN